MGAGSILRALLIITKVGGVGAQPLQPAAKASIHTQRQYNFNASSPYGRLLVCQPAHKCEPQSNLAGLG
jgi:hypothetical protein